MDTIEAAVLLLVLRGRNGRLLDGQIDGAARGDEMLPALASSLSPRGNSPGYLGCASASPTGDRDICGAQTSACQGSQRSKSRWVRKRP